jgi:hypothetical protein
MVATVHVVVTVPMVVQGQHQVQEEQGQVVGDQVALVLTVVQQVVLDQLREEQGQVVGDQVALVLTVVLVQLQVEQGQAVWGQVEQVQQLVEQGQAV